MPPFASKLPLRGEKKPPLKPTPTSTASHDKTDATIDLSPISMDDILLHLKKIFDEKFADCTKNLDSEVDSKALERVDSTFQALKIEDDSKLEHDINVTALQVEKTIINKLDLLKSEIDSSIENKLAVVDSTASSKLDTALLTDALLSSSDAKFNESLQHTFDIQSRFILNDVDSKVATELNAAPKELSKGLELVNSDLSAVSKQQF